MRQARPACVCPPDSAAKSVSGRAASPIRPRAETIRVSRVQSARLEFLDGGFAAFGAAQKGQAFGCAEQVRDGFVRFHLKALAQDAQRAARGDRPDWGVNSPEISLRSVVFPTPFRPTSPVRPVSKFRSRLRKKRSAVRRGPSEVGQCNRSGHGYGFPQGQGERALRSGENPLLHIL